MMVTQLIFRVEQWAWKLNKDGVSGMSSSSFHQDWSRIQVLLRIIIFLTGHFQLWFLNVTGELRIIFAGRELDDDLCVDSCDLGNQSILHAVSVISSVSPKAKVSSSPSQASNQSSKDDTTVTVGETNEESDTKVDNSSSKNANRTNSDAIRSMFYCWCDMEEEMSHAKLRVKCSHCQNGAIILHTDPCGWQDVLEPDRIQGKDI